MNSFDLNKFSSYFSIKERPSKYSQEYLEKAEKHLKIFRFLPGIKFIWVWNSVWMWYASENSDIDLFVITSKNSAWIIRFIMTIYFELIWERVIKDYHSAKFCLSFFITEDKMDFKDILIKDDIYMYFWILFLKPILDIDETYSKFIKINKQNFDYSKYENILKANLDNIPHKSKSKIKFSLSFLDNIIFKIWSRKTWKIKLNWFLAEREIIKLHFNDKREEIKNILR